MRSICRVGLIAVLIALVVNIPVEAANHVLGFVQAAQASFINGIAAVTGTNVTSGDGLATNSAGALELQLGANQIYVPAASAIKVNNGGSGVVATLSKGSVEFNAPGGTGVAVEAEGVLVRPKTPQETGAEITLLSNEELKIASVRGPLELELDGESYTLSPGQMYGIKIVEGAASAQFTKVKTARNRRALIIFVFASAAATAAIIYFVRELNESPEVP